MLGSSACQRDPSVSGEGPASGASAHYSAPTSEASKEIPRHPLARPDTASHETNAFYILQSELSPATLVHSETPHLTLFSGLTNYGLGAPSFVAWATRNGPRTFKPGEVLDVSVMAENWVLVWWAGAAGWTNWDCPWVVYLQHKPDSMSLDDDGLHLDFPKRAGDVVMMPLYGYEKLPTESRDFRAEHRLPALKVKIKTWEWPKVVPRDPLTRVRYWAAVMREFPIYCEETFSVDRARDTVTLRSRFKTRTISDDWRTRRIQLAPVSPALALVAKDGGFPVRFSERWFDLEMPTPFGPCFGIEGVSAYDVTFPVLRYVNEGVTKVPAVTNSNSSLQHGLRESFAKLLELELGTAPSGIRRSSALPLAMLWSYTHSNGDLELLTKYWPRLKPRIHSQERASWAGLSRAGFPGHTDEASACLAYARLAYLAGDMDAYHYGCLAFARELTGLFIQQRGGDYFRKHQPWHDMKILDEQVFATQHLGDASGWLFEDPSLLGPPTGSSPVNRWLNFADPDLARFFRDYLRRDVMLELDALQRQSTNAVTGSPIDVSQLRSILLNEGLKTNPVTGLRPQEALAASKSDLNRSFERLFPSGAPSLFVTGVECEPPLDEKGMLVSVRYRAGQPRPGDTMPWPQLTWLAWRTPAGEPWSFGHIRPVRSGSPKETRSAPFGWNAQKVVCELNDSAR